MDPRGSSKRLEPKVIEVGNTHGMTAASFARACTVAVLTGAVLLFLAGLPRWAGASGDLEDFEKEIEKGDRKSGEDAGGSSDHRTGARRHRKGSGDHHDDDREDPILEFFFWLFFGDTEPSTFEGSEQGEFDSGESESQLELEPFFRVENLYQPLVDADVQGYAVRAEAGWAFLGVAGEFLRYWEDDPNDRLDSWYVEALLRLAPEDFIRIDLALGGRTFERTRKHSGVQGGVSVGVYPWKALGFEADLRVAEINNLTMEDVRGALVVRVPAFPYLVLRSGYRSISIGSANLHGPEIGLVATW